VFSFRLQQPLNISVFGVFLPPGGQKLRVPGGYGSATSGCGGVQVAGEGAVTNPGGGLKEKTKKLAINCSHVKEQNDAIIEKKLHS